MNELTLTSDDVSLTVLPDIGGRIHRLRTFGHDLLRTPADPDQHLREPFFWGAYVMAPWGGRIDARSTDVAGAKVDVPANFSDGSAIHGQVHSRPWRVDGPGELSVSAGGDGWPWRYTASSTFTVIGRTLRVTQTLFNLSETPMPAGIGLHPWFNRRVQVRINADLVFKSNTDSAAEPMNVEGAWDARGPAGLIDGVDATWARLGNPPVQLSWPEAGVRAFMTMSARTTYVVAASPLELDAIAVEPQTHAPQGLRRLINREPGGLTLLDPSGMLQLSTELTFEKAEEVNL